MSESVKLSSSHSIPVYPASSRRIERSHEFETDVEQNVEHYVDPPHVDNSNKHVAENGDGKDSITDTDRGRKVSRRTIRRTVTVTRSTSRRRVKSKYHHSDVDLPKTCQCNGETVQQENKFQDLMSKSVNGRLESLDDSRPSPEPRSKSLAALRRQSHPSREGEDEHDDLQIREEEITLTPRRWLQWRQGMMSKEDKEHSNNQTLCLTKKQTKDKIIDLKLNDPKKDREIFFSSLSSPPEESKAADVVVNIVDDFKSGSKFDVQQMKSPERSNGPMICKPRTSFNFASIPIAPVKSPQQIKGILKNSPTTTSLPPVPAVRKVSQDGPKTPPDIEPTKLIVTKFVAKDSKGDEISQTLPEVLSQWRVSIWVRISNTSMSNDRNVSMIGNSQLFTYKDEFSFKYATYTISHDAKT